MTQATPIPAVPTQPFPEVFKPIDVEPKVEAEEEVEQLLPLPRVLQDLTPVDRLLITKRLRVKNVLFLRGKRNKFFVRTPDQNLVYTVEEENKWWVGYLCYGLRPLELRVSNSLGREVMRIRRPFAFTGRVLPCQLQNIQVFAPPEHRIGTIEQQWAAIRPIYLVKNDDGDSIFWIRGPPVTVSCFRDVQFQILRTDGSHVGATCKRWQGLAHAMFMAPVTDRFGVAFERGLTEVEKGLLLAATLLMDYMYYDV
ncbi:phospholipid scramblase 2-like [Ostrinia furnacalis]|uniref:phospholipid scramblase 2-like n=1 Tax=Ostrinia furnacalis TaxID=93504 RepID=UPI00103DC1AA|nr:phospholipid scramblase 2-like [Ostrinia furnacalis]